jgi:hypothetical protein
MASVVETPVDAGRAAEPVSLSRRRAIAAWSLVGIATILLVLSSLTIWAKRQLLDSDAYAELSVEMLHDDEIRATGTSPWPSRWSRDPLDEISLAPKSG